MNSPHSLAISKAVEQMSDVPLDRKVCHGLFDRDLVPLRGCRTCAHHEGCIPIQEELARPMPAKEPRSKYLREIKPGVWVDVYDVLQAFAVTNPALQHLVKKALQPGTRGHKTREQDLADIVASAIRAKELG